MHANYLFLINSEDLDTPDEVVSEWEETYAHYQTDENNWYEPISVFHRGILYEKNASGELEKAKRVLDVFGLAMRIAATDMGVNDACNLGLIPSVGRDELDELSKEEILEEITNQVPKSLSRAYLGAQGKKPSSRFDEDGYERMKKARQYELFMDSAVPPFSNHISTPYDYRCYDIRDTNDKFDALTESVLVIDIHT